MKLYGKQTLIVIAKPFSQGGDTFNMSLLLSVVMVMVGIVFLNLSLLFPSQIEMGACVASLLIAAVFYTQYKRQKKNVSNN